MTLANDAAKTDGWTAQNKTATPVESGHYLASGITASVVDEAEHPTAGRGRNAQNLSK